MIDVCLVYRSLADSLESFSDLADIFSESDVDSDYRDSIGTNITSYSYIAICDYHAFR